MAINGLAVTYFLRLKPFTAKMDNWVGFDVNFTKKLFSRNYSEVSG